jgi:hypothetical protein
MGQVSSVQIMYVSLLAATDMIVGLKLLVREVSGKFSGSKKRM